MIYYQNALEINKSIMFWRYTAMNLANIGVLYKKMGEYDKALDYLFQASEMQEEQKLFTKLSSSYSNIGNTYLLLNKFDEAMIYITKGLNYALKYNSLSSIAKSYKNIHNLYLEMDDFEKALETYKIYQSYQDSIIDKDMKKSFIEIQTKYETEEKEKENQTLKIEKELNDKVRLYFIILLIALIITLLSITYFFVHKSRLLKRNKQYYEKEKQLNLTLKKTSELEKKRFEEIVYAEQKINQLQKDKIIAKNKELTAVVLADNNKNSILSNLSQEIEHLEKQEISKKQVLNKFKQIVSGTQVVEDDWLTFKQQIEKVYHDFFKRLRDCCPDLTTNEQRLCSYLLIDMSSKEIAQTLNVTVAAIDKARQRLRRKIKIDSNQDFSTFFREI